MTSTAEVIRSWLPEGLGRIDVGIVIVGEEIAVLIVVVLPFRLDVVVTNEGDDGRDVREAENIAAEHSDIVLRIVAGGLTGPVEATES